MSPPALVLTAGLGTRLDPLTRLVAKPVVPLAGKTLVERVLGWLRQEGVTDVVLNLHHRPETIAELVGDGAHLGLRVRYSWEPVILGSAGGPRLAMPLLDAETFLIVNGDTLTSVPLAPMLDAHRRHGAEVTMAVVPNPRPDHYNSIVLDDEDRVTGFVPKAAKLPAGPAWHFIGIQIANASVFSSVPDGVPTETVAGIYRERVVQAPGRIRGWRLHVPFVDVGTPRDYLDAALALAGRGGGASVVEAGAAVDDTARLDRSVVWAGARIAGGARLDRCVVAGEAAVPSGFQAQNAIVVPSRVARPGDAAEILGDVAVFPVDRALGTGH